MIRNVAIVEDEDKASMLLTESIKQYEKEFSCQFNITRFKTADDFLDQYTPIYAVVFMDIQMEGTDGIKASFKLREVDKLVSIIFITNLTQYAQKGYEVDAIGYLLKPVSYHDFALKFKKALDAYVMIEPRNVLVNLASGMCHISCDKLVYVEVIKHRLYYHLVDGVLETTGVLSVAEKTLEPFGFLRCNSCYLVNPNFVIGVKGQLLEIGNETLTISRPRRAEFLNKLALWFSNGGQGGTFNGRK